MYMCVCMCVYMCVCAPHLHLTRVDVPRPQQHMGVVHHVRRVQSVGVRHVVVLGLHLDEGVYGLLLIQG